MPWRCKKQAETVMTHITAAVGAKWVNPGNKGANTSSHWNRRGMNERKCLPQTGRPERRVRPAAGILQVREQSQSEAAKQTAASRATGSWWQYRDNRVKKGCKKTALQQNILWAAWILYTLKICGLSNGCVRTAFFQNWVFPIYW